MRDLVDTTEMYLRTIYELEEEGITPLRARIAERLDQSGPTVSQTVSRMERDGLLTVARDRSLKLSAEGRDRATAVMRKHRLAERLLTDVLGLPWEKVHDEACRWEHVMGDEVEQRLVGVLENYSTSPFGNPIPGLSELMETADESNRTKLEKAVDEQSKFSRSRAVDVDSLDPIQVKLLSINEIVQVEHKVMTKLSALGMNPGSIVTLETTDNGLTFSNDNGSIELHDELCHAIRVEPVED
ncbi:MAG TPA: metal-dependent regulator [Candidatus Corynebacterium gallistercoris]|uniref:Diphtheria toxin repressor n=1 Tax=Candidatus Corynebacterium gallistercoris TaxID=2838530 RepID=A0A9D1UQI2_9CORY|nr:metal-dependent regulator [Candidatus Corynebacterium gallistercoris]